MLVQKMEYNEGYYEEGIGGFHASSYPKITAAFEARLGELKPNSKILDFGCGNGFYGQFLNTKSKFVDGVDAAMAITNSPKAKFYRSIRQADLGKCWSSETQYDVAFSIEVIEHVEDYRQFLRNALLALKPGGVLFLTTTGYFWSLFVMLIIYRRTASLNALIEFTRGLAGNERARTQFVTRFWDYFGGHYHGFSKRQLYSALQEIGFEIISVEELHVQTMFPVHYLNQPYGGGCKWLVSLLLPPLKLVGRIINWSCERFDLSAPNILVVAKRPG